MKTPLERRIRIMHITERPYVITHNMDRNDFGIIKSVYNNHLGTDKSVAFVNPENDDERHLEMVWLEDITYDLFQPLERVVTDCHEPGIRGQVDSESWHNGKPGTVISVLGPELCRKYVVVLDNGAVIVSDGIDLNLE